MKVLICVWVPHCVWFLDMKDFTEGVGKKSSRHHQRKKSHLQFVRFQLSLLVSHLSSSSFFCSQQMRLPLRSFCIFRSLYPRAQTTNTHTRGLSGVAMRLVQFHRHGDGRGIRVGVEQGEGLGVVDLKAFEPSMPSTMRELLELGDEGLDCAQRYQTFLHSVTLLLNAVIH